MTSKLTATEIKEALVQLNTNLSDPWELVDGKLHKSLTFDTFIEAFGFMTKVAIVAEVMHHHPEWTNVYNQLYVDLTTHSVGGLSGLDFELASKMDAQL